jgi:hypothetical protein
MKNNVFKRLLFVFAVFVCMSTQCNKESLMPPKYNFIEQLDLFPAQKDYKVGDTIWLQYNNVSKSMYDFSSRQQIPVASISVNFSTALNSKYQAPVNPPDGFCDFISSNGVNINRHLDAHGSSTNQMFGCSANDIDFKIGIVLKKTGIYSIDLPDNIWGIYGCPNRASKFPYSTIAFKFNVSDCNKDIYLSIPAASRGESPKGSYGKSN